MPQSHHVAEDVPLEQVRWIPRKNVPVNLVDRLILVRLGPSQMSISTS